MEPDPNAYLVDPHDNTGFVGFELEGECIPANVLSPERFSSLYMRTESGNIYFLYRAPGGAIEMVDRDASVDAGKRIVREINWAGSIVPGSAHSFVYDCSDRRRMQTSAVEQVFGVREFSEAEAAALTGGKETTIAEEFDEVMARFPPPLADNGGPPLSEADTLPPSEQWSVGPDTQENAPRLASLQQRAGETVASLRTLPHSRAAALRSDPATQQAREAAIEDAKDFFTPLAAATESPGVRAVGLGGLVQTAIVMEDIAGMRDGVQQFKALLRTHGGREPVASAQTDLATDIKGLQADAKSKGMTMREALARDAVRDVQPVVSSRHHRGDGAPRGYQLGL